MLKWVKRLVLGVKHKNLRGLQTLKLSLVSTQIIKDNKGVCDSLDRDFVNAFHLIACKIHCFRKNKHECYVNAKNYYNKNKFLNFSMVFIACVGFHLS